MFKLYKKADILEKISDKVKTVDDLLNLPLSEFDRECCDYSSYGVGIVVERCMSASGVNELYSVLFNRVLSNNGVKRVFGSDLKFVRHTEPEKGEQK